MKFALVFAAILAVSVAQPPAAIFDNLKRLPTRPPPPLKPIGLRGDMNLLPTSTRRSLTPKPVASNRVASSDQAAKVLCYDNKANPDGSYRYNVQIDNGIAAGAEGKPRDFGGNPPVTPIVVLGYFSWTSPEGQPIITAYVADENGYRIIGDDYHGIRVPSSIARSIIKGLQKRRRNRTE